MSRPNFSRGDLPGVAGERDSASAQCRRWIGHMSRRKHVNRAVKILGDVGDELVGATEIKSRDVRSRVQLARQIAQDVNRPPIIVNAGLLNAGKSTLLNALCREEVFDTKSVRCTTSARERRTEDFVLVDTPGVDAEEHDEAEAESALERSDAILFVHSAKRGELEAEEVAFLRELQDYFPDGRVPSHTFVPVLTKAEGMSEEELGEKQRKIRQQNESFLDIEIAEIFSARGETCLKAVRTDKERLEEASGIPKLRSYLTQKVVRAAQRRRGEVALSRLVGVVEEVCNLVSSAKDALEEKREAVEERPEEWEEEFEELASTIRTLHRNYRTHRRKLG